MVNNLKKDLYIVFKSKYWLVLLLSCMIFIGMVTTMKYYQSDMNMEQVEKTAENFSETAYVLDNIDNSVFEYIELIMCSDALLMFISVFAVMLALQEFQSGYIKNTWPIVKNKIHYLFSKQIILGIFIIIIFIMTIIVEFTLGGLVYDLETTGSAKNFIVMCLYQFVLQMAFGTFIMFVCFCIRKQIGVAIGCIIYVAFGKTLIYTIIDLFAHKVLKISDTFEIGDYLIYGNIERIKMGTASDDVLRSMIVAFSAIVIFSFLSWFSLSRKDIV